MGEEWEPTPEDAAVAEARRPGVNLLGELHAFRAFKLNAGARKTRAEWSRLWAQWCEALKFGSAPPPPPTEAELSEREAAREEGRAAGRAAGRAHYAANEAEFRAPGTKHALAARAADDRARTADNANDRAGAEQAADEAEAALALAKAMPIADPDPDPGLDEIPW